MTERELIFKMTELKVIRKDGKVIPFNPDKIIKAVNKSADRVMVKFSSKDHDKIVELVKNKIKHQDTVTVKELHKLVELALDKINPSVAKSYRDYRDYKTSFIAMIDEVYQKTQSLRYIGDKSNANTNSSLVSTKRSLIYGELNKEFYNKFFLTEEERQACKDGYIYIHDKKDRLDSQNCCLFDVEAVMTGGFEMGNMWYSEPKDIDTACDVLGDIIMMSASMQYGGWSCKADDVLAPYVLKSFDKYLKEYQDIAIEMGKQAESKKAEEYAMKKTTRDLEQGIQGLEYKLNTVASSRGDYPFITFAFGNNVTKWGRMVSSALCKVRKEGQGKKGKKKPVLFPKLVFCYDEEYHGIGREWEHIFNEAIDCSRKAMYPDYLSLTSEDETNHICQAYKKNKKNVIFPMGCRAFLSPYYKKGGMYPLNNEDEMITLGRFNLGAITLNLIMIYQKAREENKDFYEVLEYYMNMSRQIHLRTYEYLSHMKASSNPLGYMQGGFYKGSLQADDEIAPILESATLSFGFTGLNELQRLHNGKSLVEDGEFALEVLKWIDSKKEEYKKIDGKLYAIYATPAESLCGTQVQQFRAKYGIIEGVSDRGYVSNSFHCHVTEDITGVEKQDLEHRFWQYTSGGRIQYVRYDNNYNTEAMKIMIRRAMDLGLYEGVNLQLGYCEDCGHQELNMGETCPKCGSSNLVEISRMNGYLAYSRIKGDTTLNEAKMEEISERKSM